MEKGESDKERGGNFQTLNLSSQIVSNRLLLSGTGLY